LLPLPINNTIEATADIRILRRRSINAISARQTTIVAKDMEKISSAILGLEGGSQAQSLFYGLSEKPQTVKALNALKIILAHACGLLELLRNLVVR
jgi:hypothetical protein